MLSGWRGGLAGEEWKARLVPGDGNQKRLRPLWLPLEDEWPEEPAEEPDARELPDEPDRCAGFAFFTDATAARSAKARVERAAIAVAAAVDAAVVRVGPAPAESVGS